MSDNQQNFSAMQSYSSGPDTGSSSHCKKRKATLLMPEISNPLEVKESMLQLLFEKKLTYSDVKGQNRIIIPKAYAEQYFAESATRDIICIVDDMFTGKMWTFCIRSWLNGGSRMYVLEGTAKYVEEHQIKVGDYIILYKDHEMDKLAIGFRKHGKNINYNPLAGGDENHVYLRATSPDRISSTSNHAYYPEFAPDQDETYHHLSINPEYVRKNLNMSWDEFQNFNPFDFPPK